LHRHWFGTTACADLLGVDEPLQKLGAARDRAGRVAAGLVKAIVSAEGNLTFTLDRPKLRTVRNREGRYLLRTNLSADNPELVWRCYMQMVFVEEGWEIQCCGLLNNNRACKLLLEWNEGHVQGFGLVLQILQAAGVLHRKELWQTNGGRRMEKEFIRLRPFACQGARPSPLRATDCGMGADKVSSRRLLPL